MLLFVIFFIENKGAALLVEARNGDPDAQHIF
jgi:hypothetical protein